MAEAASDLHLSKTDQPESQENRMRKPILHTSPSKPERCPSCAGWRVVPIVYGMPGPDLIGASERGEVLLGGCCISERDPAWCCLDCDANIFAELM